MAEFSATKQYPLAAEFSAAGYTLLLPGGAYLKLEDVARGLGFTTVATSGNEVIRWARVRQYLADLGVVHFYTTGDCIPENIFCRRGR